MRSIKNPAAFLAIAMQLSPGFIASAEPIYREQISIVDGDTIDVGRVRYRLVGYDTPEVRIPRRAVGPKEYTLATKATERVKQLLMGGKLDLTEKRCACSLKKINDGSCNYGRKCAILSVNGQNIGEILISEGLALRYDCAPTRCPRMPDWPKFLGDKN